MRRIRSDSITVEMAGRLEAPAGALHAPGGRGVFKTHPVDNRDLVEAFNTFAALPITRRPDERAKMLLRKMVDRGAELRAKNISRPNFGFPTFRLQNGRVNTAEIGRQFSDDWDAAVKQLKPFINKTGDLYGPRLIEMIARFKQPDCSSVEATLKRYYLLEPKAQQMDLVLYRCGDGQLMSVNLGPGTFKASNRAGRLLVTLFADGTDADPLHGHRVQEYVSRENTSALEIDATTGFGICRVMNDEFCREWLQRYEMHDDIRDERFFAPYLLSHRAMKWDIRYYLVPGLKDRYLVLNWLCVMASSILEECA
jgi:hypothetical protein